MLSDPWLTQNHLYVPDDFADIQTLMTTTADEWSRMDPYHLRNAMLRLSQYHLYVRVLVNQLTHEALQLKRDYEDVLMRTAQAMPAKTLAERKAQAQEDPACKSVRKEWDDVEAHRALLEDVPDAVKELLYSVRKAYDRGANYGDI